MNSGASGTLVTATPASGYHFTSWSDGVLTAGRTDSNVLANISVTASFAINLDTTPPTLTSVTIISNNANTASAKPGDRITLSFTADEAINSPTVIFKSGGASVSNSVSINNPSGDNWTASYIVDATDTSGAVTFTIDFSDLATNAGTQVVSTTNVSSITTDTVSPDTSITSSPSIISNSSSASFDFSSSKAGTFQCKLDAGSYAPCTSPQAYSSLSSTSHTFLVRAIDGVGNVDPTPVEFTWTVDTVIPTVSSITKTGSSPTNAQSVNFNVVFSESVSGIATDDFSITGTGALAGASVTGVSASSGSSVTVTVDTGTGDGTIRLDVSGTATIADATGNNISNIPFVGGDVYDINKSALTVAIVASSITKTAPIPVTVNLSASVTDFDSSDINLNSGTVTNFAGSGSSYTFDITSPTEGTVTITIPADAAHDSANNGNLLTNLHITYDITGPTLSGVTPVSVLSNDTTPSYTFHSNEAGNITYGGSCGTASPALAIVGDNIVTFGALPNGTYSNCTILVTDTAGNPSTLLPIPSFEIDSNQPVTKLTTSCVASTFTVSTFVNCIVTRLNASDVEITSGSNQVNLSSSSGSASFNPNSVTIPGGSSSVGFQYTDALPGDSVITAASSDPSISSGSFNITASPTPIISTRIDMNLDNNDVCTTNVVKVTLQAVDNAGHADTLLDGNVTLAVTGSATPNSLPVHLSGGFYQTNIADANAEIITVSLVDVDTGKIMPDSASVTFRTCGGGGGSISNESSTTPTNTSTADIFIAGKSASVTGGTINVFGVNVSDSSTTNLVPLGLAVKPNQDGSFVIKKENIPANFPAFGIQYTDVNGNSAPFMLYNNDKEGNINVKSANIPPTVSISDDHFAFFTYIRGYAKDKTITLYIDGKMYKKTNIKADDSYEIQVSANDLSDGQHTFYVVDGLKGKSLEQSFQIVKTRIPQVDTNKDGKVNLADVSAFNATFLYEKTGGKLSDSQIKKFDFNKNGTIDQGDFSKLLQAIKK